MKAFQAIADANPGLDGHPSRNSGEPGYLASVQYVAQKMKQAGYDVTIQPYKFTYTLLRRNADAERDRRRRRTTSRWSPTGIPAPATGTADADVQPAGGIVLPPTPTPSSTSGCTAADFGGFPAGKIALIQRGTCNFGVKVLNAQAAGAAGVVIFNEGNPGRTGVLERQPVDADSNPFVPTIPVGFTSFAIGQQPLQRLRGRRRRRTRSSTSTSVVDPNRDDYNVIAESKGGDPNHVVVVDAHLDAIFGAGMLDNASGSATILNIAEQMRKVHPRNKLRFIWFGGEELGLLGSSFYVNHLPPAELAKIGYDLDADVTATQNGRSASSIRRPTTSSGGTVTAKFPDNVYAPSKIARDTAP